MDEYDLMKVRMLIAEGRAAGSARHSEFMSRYADIAMELMEFWRSKAPAGTELPAELVAKIDEFREQAA